mgnify:CR=1 FL=1
MELVRWQPFEGRGNINDRFDNVYGRSRFLHAVPTGFWYPAVDILESKDAYLIRAELPGMKKEDIHLELEDGTLTLSGERKFEEPTNGDEYHRVERLAGKFSRSFHIPQAVKDDGIKATYRDGILEVSVPKAEEAKPRQITVSLN